MKWTPVDSHGQDVFPKLLAKWRCLQARKRPQIGGDGLKRAEIRQLDHHLSGACRQPKPHQALSREYFGCCNDAAARVLFTYRHKSRRRPSDPGWESERSAGDGGSAISSQMKKRCWSAVARAGNGRDAVSAQPKKRTWNAVARERHQRGRASNMSSSEAAFRQSRKQGNETPECNWFRPIGGSAKWLSH
jgi:hypothetical protein